MDMEHTRVRCAFMIAVLPFVLGFVLALAGKPLDHAPFYIGGVVALVALFLRQPVPGGFSRPG